MLQRTEDIVWLLALPAWGADLTGTWRLDLHLVHEVEVPVLGRTRSTSRSTQLWRVDGNTATKVQCGIDIRTSMPIGRPRVPDAFIDHLPVKSSTLQVSGDRFFADMGESRVGFEGNVMPLEADDPQVVDHEGDGHPGATLTIWAPMFGHVPIYVAQQNRLELEGTIQGDRVEGTARQTLLVQRTLAARNRLFRSQPTLTPVVEESTFTLGRVEPGLTCDDLEEAP